MRLSLPWVCFTLYWGGGGLNGRETGFTPSLIDLGEQSWNTEVPFTMAFVNRENAPVKIVAVKSSCGCTVVEKFEGQAIAAGQLITQSATLKTHKRPDLMRSTITITLDNKKQYSCEVIAAIRPAYLIDRNPVLFESVDLTSREPEVQIVRFKSRSVKLLSAVPDSKWLKATMKAEGIVEVAVDPCEMRLGKLFGRITLETDDVHVKDWTLIVHAWGVHGVRASPSALYLRPGMTAEIKLLSAKGTPLRIAKWHASDPVARAELANAETLRVSFDAKPSNGAVQYALMDEMNREVKVAVTYGDP